MSAYIFAIKSDAADTLLSVHYLPFFRSATEEIFPIATAENYKRQAILTQTCRGAGDCMAPNPTFGFGGRVSTAKAKQVRHFLSWYVGFQRIGGDTTEARRHTRACLL